MVINMLFTQIKPMLLTLGDEAFDSDDFIYEVKWDGWRIMLHKDGKRIEAYTKNGMHVTDAFPELQDVAKAIKANTAIVDCEGVCIREDTRPSLDDFCYRGRLRDPAKIKSATQTHPATFVAFDVLYTNNDHTHEPLIDRKKRLQELILPSDCIVPSMFIESKGEQLSQLTIEKDLEGIVAKRKDSRYQMGVRSADWIKIKNYKQIDTVILGYRTVPSFALVVGLNFRTVQNKPVAVVEFGIRQEEKIAFLEIVRQLHTVKDKTTQWVEPRLCCRIQYRDRTDTHHLREVSFKGFLFDKKPEECRWIS
ncbi:DNA ligase [Ammoniphilus sp. 3BR4]|uniref:ATP-dependent DNA ligase n=1 Tax=Ammoniphilus sp. 3BR4 TaxID=3158265 RepID=UPI003466FF90